jgi:hypothetical protein
MSYELSSDQYSLRTYTRPRRFFRGGPYGIRSGGVNGAWGGCWVVAVSASFKMLDCRVRLRRLALKPPVGQSDELHNQQAGLREHMNVLADWAISQSDIGRRRGPPSVCRVRSRCLFPPAAGTDRGHALLAVLARCRRNRKRICGQALRLPRRCLQPSSKRQIGQTSRCEPSRR